MWFQAQGSGDREGAGTARPGRPMAPGLCHDGAERDDLFVRTGAVTPAEKGGAHEFRTGVPGRAAIDEGSGQRPG